MSSIVTDKQRKRLQERPSDDSPEKVLKDRRLNDFYARKALSRWLDSIEDINLILSTLPPEQLDRNEILKADMVLGLFKIVEKLSEMLDPSPYASRDVEGKYHIYRRFMVNLAGSIPTLGDATASVEVCYEASAEEVKFFQRLTDHISILETMYLQNERPNEILSTREMEKRIKFAVKGRPYKSRVSGLTGFPVDTDAIMKGDKPLHEILPDLDKIDLHGNGLPK